LRLTMPALETLAVIAYKQPITAPEIQEIRGVNTSGVLKTLLDKRLITTAGRKEVIGRPILYRSSKEFLMRFGLSDLEELPSLKEFEALAREALGSDEGLASSDSGDESVLDQPRPVGIAGTSAETASANEPDENRGEPVVPHQLSDPDLAQLSSERAPAEGEEKGETHKAATAGE
jgi:segregation and condensation protein B